jgi:hypothetical protein
MANSQQLKEIVNGLESDLADLNPGSDAAEYQRVSAKLADARDQLANASSQQTVMGGVTVGKTPTPAPEPAPAPQPAPLQQVAQVAPDSNTSGYQFPTLKQSLIDNQLNKLKTNSLTSFNSDIRDQIYNAGWNQKSDAVQVLNGAAVYGLVKPINAGVMGSPMYQKPNGGAVTDADFVNAAKAAGIDPSSYYHKQAMGMGGTQNVLDKNALYNAINDKSKDLYSITNAIEGAKRGDKALHATALYKADGNGNLVIQNDPTTGQPDAKYFSTVRYASDPGFLADLGPLLGIAGLAFGAPLLGELFAPAAAAESTLGLAAGAGLGTGTMAGEMLGAGVLGAGAAPVLGETAALGAGALSALAPAATSGGLNLQSLAKQAGQGAVKGVVQSALSDIVSGKGLNTSDLLKGAFSGGLGGGVGNVATQFGANPIVSQGLSGATTAGTNAALNKGNVLKSVELGGGLGAVAGGTNMLLSGKDANGNPVYSPVEKGAISGAIQGGAQALLNKKDPITGALVNAAGGAAGAAVGNATGNPVVDKSLAALASVGTKMAATNILGQSTGALGLNQVSALVPTTQGTTTIDPITGQPVQQTTQNGQLMDSQLAALQEELNFLNRQNYLKNANEYSVSDYINAQAGVPSGEKGYTGFLTPGVMTTSAAPMQETQQQQPVDTYQQIYSQLANVDPRLLNILNQRVAKNGGAIKMAAGGSALAALEAHAQKLKDQQMLRHFEDASRQLALPNQHMGNVPYGNPSGGALMHPISPGYFVTRAKEGGEMEHQPEFITGATGHYVKGKGDGQSDDIPAMLADGEYVFDADTVAALGNGSSDAGAKLLDHFRESLREHKRSAPADKIPPKAAPLQYMKEALRRHKG